MKKMTIKDKIIFIIISMIIGISFIFNILTIIQIKNRRLVFVKAEENEEHYIQFMHKQFLTNEDISIIENTNIDSVNMNNGAWVFCLLSEEYENQDNNEQLIQIAIRKIQYSHNSVLNTHTIDIEGYYYVNGQFNYYSGQNTIQIRYNYQSLQYSNTNINLGGININFTEENFYNSYWLINDNQLLELQQWLNLENILYTNVVDIPQLDTPIIELNFQTITWQAVENATYYNIFRNGNLVGQTNNTQWVTITNGNYKIQACNDSEEYLNSELSNEVTQNRYNDMIGNGANWFTFMSALVDSTIYLLKSMLYYEVWGINFYNLLKLFITIVILWFITKFVVGNFGKNE